MLRKALERAGYEVDEAADGTAAVSKVRARRYLLVLTDLKLPGCSGLEVLRESKLADPSIAVILITAFGSVEEAVTAMKRAPSISFEACRSRPVEPARRPCGARTGVAAGKLLLREEYTARYGFPRIVGEDPTMQATTQQAQRVAALIPPYCCSAKAVPARSFWRAPRIIFPTGTTSPSWL